MRLVAFDKAHFGHKIHNNIFNHEGQCLFTAGTNLSPAIMDRLQAMGFQTLVISDSLDAGIDPKPLVSDGLRLSGFKLMHKIFQALHGKTDPATAPDLDMKPVFELCNAIVDEVALGERGRIVDLLAAKPLEYYDAEHSVQVAVLSAYIGARLGYNLMHLRDLVVGAILHDIGEAFVPENIRKKKGKLTQEELAQVQQHGVFGFRYLTRFSDIKATSRAVAIQHHERISGKGYPKGLAASQIHPFSGIVGACDIFDAMTSDRPHRIRQPSLVALGVILSTKEQMFSPEIRDVVSHIFAPFPVGTWVTLSDGRHGIVKAVPKETPSRPDVKVVYDNIGQSIQSTTIKLGQTPELRIAGIPGEF